MEAEERGFNSIEKFVCADCVTDSFLKQVVGDAVSSRECDYCESEANEDIAAPVDSLMDIIMPTLLRFFAEPTQAGVRYERSEDGFDAEIDTTEDALSTLGLMCDDGLFEDIAESISAHNDCWVQAAGGVWLSEHHHEELTSAWERFQHRVKHRQRYFFTETNQADQEELSPASLLKQLAQIASDLRLITSVAAATPLFRARVVRPGEDWDLDAENLGPPPDHITAAGRMNPAGIPYLYTALDAETAFAEVIQGPPCVVVLGQFRATRELKVLNLTELPDLPSIFDDDRREVRDLVIFFDRFVKAISKPVAKDGAEHVSYVPSQVVCEYFAHAFSKKTILDGLMYPSAIHEGGRNLVLFPLEEYRDRFPQVTFEVGDKRPVKTWAEVRALINMRDPRHFGLDLSTDD